MFVNSPCFSYTKKHAEFTKTPQIRKPACESAFLWFGLPGRPLSIHNFILFRISFPDYYVIFLFIAEVVSNKFVGYVISCVAVKYTVWTSDYIS